MDEQNKNKLKELIVRMENKRMELVYRLDSSFLLKWWDLFDVVVNFIFVWSYITLTVLSAGKRGTIGAPPPPDQIYQDWDFYISALLIVQWMPRLILSLNPSQELLTTFSITTITSTLSVVYVYFNFIVLKGTFLEGGNVVYLFPLRFIRLYESISRCFVVGQKGFFQLSPIKQKAINVFLTVITTLMAVSSWVHIVLYKVQKYYDLTFFDIFYTVTVSSTSGLNTQIVPDNIFSRIVTLGVMGVGVVFLPPKLSDLLTLVRSHSSYNRSYKPIKNRDHVVIVGNLETVSLERFLKEFFSSDHGLQSLSTSVVILGLQEPSSELESLLTDPVYAGRVKYVKGSALKPRSLFKVKLNLAKAVFVLASRISDCEPVEEDSKTVMRCVSLRKTCKEIPIYAQILMPRNKVHLENLADHILCIEEVKLGMVAQSCLSLGFTTLLYILTNSVSSLAIENVIFRSKKKWLEEYLGGCAMELYEVEMDEEYAGKSVEHAALLIHKEYNAILIAIGYPADGNKGTFGSDLTIQFFPTGYVLKGGEHVFLIADEKDTVDKIGAHIFSPQVTISNDLEDIERKLEENKARTINLITKERMIAVSSGVPEVSLENLSYPLRKEVAKKDFTVIPIKNLSGIGGVELEVETPDQRQWASQHIDFSPHEPQDSLQYKEFSVQDLGTEGSMDIRGHVLICLLAKQLPRNLAYFAAPFRQSEPATPIVILCEGAADSDHLTTMAKYGKIVFVRGSPLLRKDLRRARVHYAKRTVCLADPQAANINDPLSDASMMLSLLNIQALCANGENTVLVEFLHSSNIPLIAQSKSTGEVPIGASAVTGIPGELLVPAFAGGHVFLSSMFHSIICQAFFERNLLSILKLFLFSGRQTDDSGNVSPCVFQIELPIDGGYFGLEYGDIFDLMIKKWGCVCFGLYREVSADSNFNYVVLNPSRKVLLQEGDSLYLIGKEKPLL